MERKKKFKHDFGVRHILYYHNKNYPKRLEYKDISTVLNIFNNKLIESLYKGAYITLPYSLGDLYIYKYKPKFRFDKNGTIITKNKFKMIDYKATNKLWKTYPELAHKKYICYDNFHTDGYKFRIKWKRYHKNRLNRLYNFTPARSFSRGLAQYLRKNPNQSYYGK
jgi:hypothetical protein